jgi:hypothetical protein
MDFDSFSLVIDKEAIENLDFSMIKDFIAERDFDETLLYEASNRLDISFFGYNDDPREIFEVPEIQKWVKISITEEKIPWFFFLSTDETSQSIKSLALCYIAEPVKSSDGTVKFQPMQKKLQAFAMINYGTMNEFFETHQLTESMKVQVSQKIDKYFHAWLD